jgi:hypothetical protein
MSTVDGSSETTPMIDIARVRGGQRMGNATPMNSRKSLTGPQARIG